MVSSTRSSAPRRGATSRVRLHRLTERWPWWAGLGLLLSPILAVLALSRQEVYHALESERLPGRWALVEARRPPEGLCLDCLSSLVLSAPEAGVSDETNAGTTRHARRPTLALRLGAGATQTTSHVAAWMTFGGALAGPVTRLDLPGDGRTACLHGEWLPDWLDVELHTGHWPGHDQLRVFAGPSPRQLPQDHARPLPLVYARD